MMERSNERMSENADIQMLRVTHKSRKMTHGSQGEKM